MHARLSIALTLLFVTQALALPDKPAASDPLPVVAVGCGDCLDFFLLLDDPAVKTQIVSVTDCGDYALVAVVHTTVNEASTWAAIYTFPFSILAHSIVNVPFHADEME